MRFKIQILAIILCISFIAKAQTFEVKYTQTMDIQALNDSLDKNERAKAFLGQEMKDQIFSELKKPQDYILTYSNGKSIYQIAPEKEVESEEEDLEVGHKFNFSIMRRKFSSITYKDFENNKEIQKRDIFNKEFLITDSLQTLDWEISDQVKTFGEFTCTMATATNVKNQKVSACFSEDIPISEGPDEYYGLPGLVVEVSVGPVRINVSELKIIDENTDIEAPSGGKVVTRQEFKDLMKEKMEQMGNQQGMSIFH